MSAREPWKVTLPMGRPQSFAREADAVAYAELHGGTVTDTSMGWVIGNVRAGGRGYFYVPVSTPAPTYRATVQSYDKIAIDSPQAP